MSQGSAQKKMRVGQLHGHRGIAPSGAYARATPRELGEAGASLRVRQQRSHRELMQDIPRLSSIGSTQMRIDGFVPRNVRQAAAPLPPEVKRLHPRFSRDRAFIYRDQAVILNPRTARIVALVKIT